MIVDVEGNLINDLAFEYGEDTATFNGCGATLLGGILAVVALIQIHINARFVTQNISQQNDENFRSVKSKDVH